MKTTFYSLPVDYFLWSDKGATSQTLVYYDENGQAHEKEVPKEQLEKALKFFDGKLYSLARTNGGRMSAEPYELVVCECKRPGAELEPEVRIGMRFTDLKRDRTRMVISNEVVYHTKYVTVEELEKAVQWTTAPEQRYVLEFGRGLIPIKVLQFVENEQGVVEALFVREDELKALCEEEAGQQRHLSIYRIPRDVLRQSRPLFGGKTDEYEIAKENVKWLLQTGDTIVPKVLKTNELLLGTGHSEARLLEGLQMRILTEINHKKVMKKNSERLIPFGIFEVR